jgi:6-pyruvoyltetrahydropterin/6-carboxytetrahydropterin synthase
MLNTECSTNKEKSIENPVSRIEMLTISVETHFRASHQLALPDGSKERAHGHNWLVTADVSSETLNPLGVVMDFRQLKAMVDDIVGEFDDAPLDSLDYFQRNNPSAEHVAKYIYQKLEPKLPKDIKLRSVKVEEEPGCSAKFEHGNNTNEAFGKPSK